MIKRIINFFTKGKKRSVLAKKHAAASFIITGINGAIGLLLVPLLLNYLDQTQYGIWLTMISIISWFGFMDIGLGNGLRNKFAIAKANDNHEQAKKYVSTTYAILFVIALLVFLLFILGNQFISWSAILNVDQSINPELSELAVIIFGFFCLRFVAELITTIITANQKPAIKKAITLAGKILMLIAISLLVRNSTSSLIYVGLIYTGSPVLVLFIASWYFYSTDYNQYIPSVHFIELSYAKDLIGLGWKFFVIQISMIVLFTTDNIIISQLFGPKQVAPYDIASKYYGIVLMIFSILVSTMWSAYTEAFEKNDFDWIKRVIRKQENIWYLIIFVIIGMTLISNSVYGFWVGNKIHIKIYLSISWGLLVVLQTYSSIYTNFLNGIGKIKIQMITSVISIILNVPLSILLARIFGLTGVILATCFSMVIYAAARKKQVLKILNNSAEGIWDA